VPVGAVDVNVRRVLGRIVVGRADGIGATALQEVADAAVPRDEPGTWTHAVMDVGAALCRPRVPRCEACPARPWCRYAGIGRSPDGRRPHATGDVDRAPPPRPRGAREAPAPFASTNRWLRGRILDRLRGHDDGVWVELDDAIGEHDRDRVIGAAEALAREGLIELAVGEDGIVRGRLALA
jgi:A/G-specific adenine glycosylase